MKNLLLLTAIVIFSASCSRQQNNWHQYTGPNRNATTTGEQIFDSWPEEGPEELWSLPLGPGYGGASIYNDEVFVLDRKKGEKDILRCIDLNTGNEKWNYSYQAQGEIPYPGSRAVPTVDENYVWSVGPHGHFHCIDKKTQQPVWSLNILKKVSCFDSGKSQAWSPMAFSSGKLIARDMEKMVCVDLGN